MSSNNGASPMDLWRLAQTARERGIRVYCEPLSGDWFATSASNETKLYRVTAYSCTCRGFFRHQRCSHHSALLDHLGWLPDVEPEPPAPLAPAFPEPAAMVCPYCLGSGRDWADANGLQVSVTCPLCYGTGEVEGIADDADDGRAAHGRGVDDDSTSVVNGYRRCPTCYGDGVRRVHLGGPLANWVAEPCRTCNATGQVLSEAA